MWCFPLSWWLYELKVIGLKRSRRDSRVSLLYCTVWSRSLTCRPAALSDVPAQPDWLFSCVEFMWHQQHWHWHWHWHVAGWCGLAWKQYWGQSIKAMFSPLFPQVCYALASYFSSRSRAMSRSCGGTPLSWTVRRTASRPSTSDGSRTA